MAYLKDKKEGEIAKVSSKPNEKSNFGIVVLVLIVFFGVVAFSLMNNQKATSAFSIASLNCTSTEVRPCYEQHTAKKIIGLSQESGTRAFAACLNSASQSQRGESVQATSICGDEIYDYCNEGKSKAVIKRFNGNCKTAPPVTVVYPNGGEELLQGYYYILDDRVHWRGEYYDLKFSGGKGKFQVMLVKESATNNADPTDLIVGYILGGTLPFPAGTGYTGPYL
ncbi:MAG: hypothetical protein AABX59_01885, partial [Nanoarchaeota archaeon]